MMVWVDKLVEVLNVSDGQEDNQGMTQKRSQDLGLKY